MAADGSKERRDENHSHSDSHHTPLIFTYPENDIQKGAFPEASACMPDACQSLIFYIMECHLSNNMEPDILFYNHYEQ